MNRLTGKVAIVTGGAAGLGKSIARRLADDGASVVITDIQSTVEETTDTDGRLFYIEHDVRDEQRWNEVVLEVESRLGGIHVLVNNAGIAGPMDAVSPVNTRLEDWRQIFAVNLEGVFLGCKSTIPVIARSGGGSIVNVSSIAGLQATPGGTAYGASKAAVRQLTKSVAQYCAKEKLRIRCNSVHPGAVLTPMLEECFRGIATASGRSVGDVVVEATNSVPLGDLTLPADVAAAVSFLASEESRHVTGAKIIVDGGAVGCDTFRRDATAES